jgi:hypothetical protein
MRPEVADSSSPVSSVMRVRTSLLPSEEEVAMDSQGKNVQSNPEAREALARAEKVTLTDFSAALTSGVLSAIEARKAAGSGAGIDWRRWIWAGWIIGDNPWGPGGPIAGDDPFGAGGSGRPPAPK